ncbi:SpoIID/LytB domain-containing protein [Fonticella tunisiensis]|uniref:SpoIID/LytB domain protein n=1 Tax=Fonticella tunisiensis TaxID=1096341 RepID=A0A4R7KAD9_9CLOT|nr:SpoIID/LytB domain-containing protein [Fonticella tunisiensis]TDT50834.1 SpoIID/LytB domain protein [Fonticella tunisiensis]
MKKFAISFFTALSFLLSMLFYASPALGYTNSNYYRDLRVGLKNMLSPSVNVTLSGEYKAGEKTYASGTSFTLTVSNGKVLFNGEEYDSITFVPSSDKNTIKLRVNNGTIKEYSYLGSMTFKVSDNQVFEINTINIEDYLKGVVPYEMSNSYPLEALKAQAVAARNYALANMGKYNSYGYDIDDTISNQVYRGYNSYYANAIRAVEETRGMVLLYGDKLVNAYYSASNGGYTEASENVWLSSLPYFNAKPDAYDKDPSYDWTASFTSSEIDEILKNKGYLSETDSFIKIDTDTIRKYESGRISNIEIVYSTSTGSINRKAFGKESARTFLGLKSSLYDVSLNDGVYTFTGKGYGHGVGLSQIGARDRAKAGQTYEDILKFYYDGSYLYNLRTRITSFNLDKTKIIQGDGVTFTSQASNGNIPLYRYIVKKGDSVVYTRDYSEVSKDTFTPGEPGDYSVELYVKDKLSTQDYEATDRISFSVYAQPKIKTVTVSPEKPVEKKPVSVSVEYEGGSTDGVEYKYEILKSGKFISTGLALNSTYSFTPDSSGQYVVKAYIKDKLSTKQYDDVKEITVTVEKTPAAPPTPQPSTPGSTSFSLSRTLKKGSRGEDVKWLQDALKRLGYYKSTIDGSFGPGTYSAVVAFQRANGLKADGVVGPATASKINEKLQGGTTIQPIAPPTSQPSTPGSTSFSLSRTLKKGSRGEDVKRLQDALKRLGYYKSTIDGSFGPGTYSAVVAFQRANNLATDGIVGPATAAKINEKLR